MEKKTQVLAIITGSKMYLFKIEPIVGLGRGGYGGGGGGGARRGSAT